MASGRHGGGEGVWRRWDWVGDSAIVSGDSEMASAGVQRVYLFSWPSPVLTILSHLVRLTCIPIFCQVMTEGWWLHAHLITLNAVHYVQCVLKDTYSPKSWDAETSIWWDIHRENVQSSPVWSWKVVNPEKTSNLAILHFTVFMAASWNSQVMGASSRFSLMSSNFQSTY